MKMMEDDDCTVEVVTVKKKKLKQAQLPFQTLSSAKILPDSSITTSKKRKVTSPLESKSLKISKFCKEDCQNVQEDEAEKDTIEENNGKKYTVNDEGKDLELDDQQNDENGKKDDVMSKKNSGKRKKLDESQKKSSVLTNFLKRRKSESITENDTCESKSQDLQDTSVQEDKEAYLDENLELQSADKCKLPIDKELKNSSAHDSDTKRSSLEQPDCNVTILSSDNEIPSELDQSTSSKNEENNKSTNCATPKSDAKKLVKKLTPKQLKKRQEIAMKREEKLKLKMKKQKKQEEEKANRRKEREEKQKEKEEKDRIEKEQKKKEKELKELKKQMEIEQKQKDKEAKEEERRKREETKEEEKRRKEEEKLESKRKMQKAATNFASFFVSKKQEVKQTEQESVVETRNFMPFEVKADMKIAPIRRRTLSERGKSLLDQKCDTNVQKCELYLENLRKGRIIPGISTKTWPLEMKDVILLDEISSNIIRDTHDLEKHRPKLLQFSENRRPPYWGTWRKRSKFLNSRRPFAKDKTWFDYEVDSDDEWEEEEPGESLKGSDDEDEENPEENEYDVDNEFMVPHGYLSDEEARADEEEMQEDMSPQTQKLKLKLLGEQFEAERNAKTHKLKPRIIGCFWEDADRLFSESIRTEIKEILLARRGWVRSIPVTLPSSLQPTTEADESSSKETETRKGPKKTKFPNEALVDLIRLLHGNTHGRHFLMREFMTFWNRKDGGLLSKVSVMHKINDIAQRIACPKEGPMHLRSCWYVHEDVRKEHLPDEELPLPNRWTYILTPSRKSNPQDLADKPEKEEKEQREKDKDKKNLQLITQFAKKITQKDMQKQLTKPEEDEEEATSKALPVLPPKLPPLQRPPKRATLISVGRGEQFPEKCYMLTKFVNSNKKQEKASTSSEKTTDDDDNDIIYMETVTNETKDRKSKMSDNMTIAANHDGDAKPSEQKNTNVDVIIVKDCVK